MTPAGSGHAAGMASRRTNPNRAFLLIISGEILATFCVVRYVSDQIALVISSALIVGIALVLLLTFVSVIYVGLKGRNVFVASLMFIVSIASMITLFANLYRWVGLKESGAVCLKVPMPFLDGLYFSIVTWTTLGYGDLVPCEGSRLIASAEAIAGYMIMALLIAALVPGIQGMRGRGVL